MIWEFNRVKNHGIFIINSLWEICISEELFQQVKKYMRRQKVQHVNKVYRDIKKYGQYVIISKSAPESVPKDIKMDPGTVGADAATHDQGQPPQLGLHSGARLKPFSFELPTPLDSRPPPLPRTQLEDFFPSPQ